MGDVVGRLFREFAITLAVAILISAVVSLTLTPMMCARCCATRRKRSRAASIARAARWFDRVIARYGADARLGARPPGRDADRRRRHAGADRRALHRRSRRASSRCRTPARSRASPRRRSRSRSPRWPSASRRSRESSSQDPAVESLSSFIGVDGTNATLNSGRMLINLKPHARARRERDRRSSAGCRRELAQRRGHHALHAAGAGPDDRGPREPHAVPVHASRTPNPDELATWVPQLVERLRRLPQLADVASDLQDERPAGVRGHRPRDREPAGHHAGRDRQRALQRVRPAPGLDDLHADRTSTASCSRSSPSSSAARRRSTICT